MNRLYLLLVFLFAGAVAFGQSAGLPPAEAESKARLDSSPRHGEWVTVDAGGGDKVDAWVVYPERSDKAPVVLVVHETASPTGCAQRRTSWQPKVSSPLPRT